MPVESIASPLRKFFGGFEDLEVWKFLEMPVVGEHGGADFVGAGRDQDVLGGERDAGTVERPSQPGGLFPDFVARGDMDQDIEKSTNAAADFFDSQAALDLHADHAAGGEVAVADPVGEDFGGVESPAKEADVDIAVYQYGGVHFLGRADFLEP